MGIEKRLEKLRHRWSTKLLQILDAKVPVWIKQLSEQQKSEVKHLLRRGDILLKDDNSHPMGQLMNRLAGSRWSHTVFYDGADFVIDVGTKPYVAKISLDEFLQCNDLGVFRPLYKEQQDLDSASEFVEKALGRPLNRTFDINKQDAFYCAQLVYCALKQMPHPIEIPTVQIGRAYVTSGCIEKCKSIEQVWLLRTNFLQRIIGHAPTWLPPGIAAGIGFQASGVAAAIIGFICALPLSIFAANRLLRRK